MARHRTNAGHDQAGAATMLRLTGRTALVTGATRGLGFAIADKLSAAGCHVLLNYAHDDAVAEAAAKELAGRAGAVTLAKADVTDADAWRDLLDGVRADHGGLDILVHNVASARPMSALAAPVAAVHADLGTALDPLLRGAGTLAELMAGRPGRIVAVSNSGARRVIPRMPSLGVAKAALESLVRYLAVELAGQGIAVNAVSTAKLDKEGADPAVVAALGARTPAGRLTRPADVADAVALLCTDEAAWIHGQVLTVDGGFGLRD
jgi:enoyl-[acyl-carrier protein] reductase III